MSGQVLDSASLRTSQAPQVLGPVSLNHTPCQWLVPPPTDALVVLSVQGWVLWFVLAHSWCVLAGPLVSVGVLRSLGPGLCLLRCSQLPGRSCGLIVTAPTTSAMCLLGDPCAGLSSALFSVAAMIVPVVVLLELLCSEVVSGGLGPGLWLPTQNIRYLNGETL